MPFRDKLVLITGSSRGIGHETARLFLGLGAKVAINGRTDQSTHQALSALKGCDGLVPAPGDIKTVAGCEAVVKTAIERLGGLDVLVNAAGVCYTVRIEDSDEAIWDETLDTNVKGTFFCSKMALSALRARCGNIVNLASDDGLQGEREMSVYCASKAAVVNLTRAMALELAPQVRVNCVCPGYVDTDMLRRDYIDRSQDPAATEQLLKRATPMQRFSTASEIAKAIAYLASEDARFITGAALSIDGGTTAGH